MKHHLICLECKNDIDLTNYQDLLDAVKKGEREEDLIIECNHCGTDYLVTGIEEDGEVKAEIVERDK